MGPSKGAWVNYGDFLNDPRLMEKGYTYAIVDLRGTGGSSGCQDWAGPGEQADVVEAVKWAAKQPWSNGRVAIYGKSYDGVTGLIGTALRPEGLSAVLSMEPVYDDYRYLYGDGMRRANWALTPALYDGIAASPGPVADTPNDPTYTINSVNDTQRPGCPVGNLADQAANDDHYSPFWRKRNFITQVAGSNVPLFLTQGMTENNTAPDGLAEFLRNHTGPKRAWLGPWNHVRGNAAQRPRPADDGPRGLVRRGRPVLRQVPAGVKPDAPTPTSSSRPTTACGGPRRTGRPPTPTRTRPSSTPAPTATTRRRTPPARAARPASGPSRRRCPTRRCWPAPRQPSSTSAPPRRSRTWSSTSTTSAPTARARSSAARAT